jgi:hypothetical protein
LIHLGYAYELESKTVAIEALALGACFYSSLHKYIDDPKYTKPSPHHLADEPVPDLLQLLDKVREDRRFDGLYDHGSGDISKVLEQREDAFLEYWNAWKIEDPTKQFEQAQSVAVAILMNTPSPGKGKFDFFFVHVLTSSHAIRILLPLVPAKFHVNLLRQWWLFTLAVYIAQMRPRVENSGVEAYNGKGRDWKYVVHNALVGPHSKDAHYVKSKSMTHMRERYALTCISPQVSTCLRRNLGRREQAVSPRRNQICRRIRALGRFRQRRRRSESSLSNQAVSVQVSRNWRRDRSSIKDKAGSKRGYCVL